MTEAARNAMLLDELRALRALFAEGGREPLLVAVIVEPTGETTVAHVAAKEVAHGAARCFVAALKNRLQEIAAIAGIDPADVDWGRVNDDA